MRPKSTQGTGCGDMHARELAEVRKYAAAEADAIGSSALLSSPQETKINPSMSLPEPPCVSCLKSTTALDRPVTISFQIGWLSVAFRVALSLLGFLGCYVKIYTV